MHSIFPSISSRRRISVLWCVYFLCIPALSHLFSVAPSTSSPYYNHFDIDNDHDNLMNHDYFSSSTAQDKVPSENVKYAFDIDDVTSGASSSYILPVSHEIRTGSSFLMQLLLHDCMSGITSSPSSSKKEKKKPQKPQLTELAMDMDGM